MTVLLNYVRQIAGEGIWPVISSFLFQQLLNSQPLSLQGMARSHWWGPKVGDVFILKLFSSFSFDADSLTLAEPDLERTCCILCTQPALSQEFGSSRFRFYLCHFISARPCMTFWERRQNTYLTVSLSWRSQTWSGDKCHCHRNVWQFWVGASPSGLFESLVQRPELFWEHLSFTGQMASWYWVNSCGQHETKHRQSWSHGSVYFHIKFLLQNQVLGLGDSSVGVNFSCTSMKS